MESSYKRLIKAAVQIQESLKKEAVTVEDRKREQRARENAALEARKQQRLKNVEAPVEEEDLEDIDSAIEEAKRNHRIRMMQQNQREAPKPPGMRPLPEFDLANKPTVPQKYWPAVRNVTQGRTPEPDTFNLTSAERNNLKSGVLYCITVKGGKENKTFRPIPKADDADILLAAITKQCNVFLQQNNVMSVKATFENKHWTSSRDQYSSITVKK